MFRRTALLALLLVPLVASSQTDRGAPMPRRGQFGIQAAPDPKGIKVAFIGPGTTAEKLGLAVGDVITSVNGQTMSDPSRLVALGRKLFGGDKLEVKYLRDGKAAATTGAMIERPKESEPDLDVIYDQVKSQGKRIRVIITKPRTAGKLPTVFLIGGIGGYSVDGNFSSIPYGNVLGPIAHAGYATVRIDKPGQGDSEGPEYKNLGFNVEADAYLQALRYIKTLPFVDANRIAIYGHSMGGCFDPVVASQEPVKAVIANGTLFQTFAEYMLENTRRQSELGDEPQDALDQDQKNLSETMYYLFELGQTPKQIVKDHPALAAYVKATFPDGETYSGVGINFFRELSHTNLAKAWSGVKADVLSLYAENDFLSGRADHERLAAYVNKLRPGTAEFKLLPGMDHVFTKTTSMRDSMAQWGKGGEFNPVIVDVLLEYLKKELG